MALMALAALCLAAAAPLASAQTPIAPTVAPGVCPARVVPGANVTVRLYPVTFKGVERVLRRLPRPPAGGLMFWNVTLQAGNKTARVTSLFQNTPRLPTAGPLGLLPAKTDAGVECGGQGTATLRPPPRVGWLPTCCPPTAPPLLWRLPRPGTTRRRRPCRSPRGAQHHDSEQV